MKIVLKRVAHSHEANGDYTEAIKVRMDIKSIAADSRSKTGQIVTDKTTKCPIKVTMLSLYTYVMSNLGNHELSIIFKFTMNYRKLIMD